MSELLTTDDPNPYCHCALCIEKDAEIKRLKSEIIQLQADAKRWRVLVERYAGEPSSYPLIAELIEEVE